MPYLGGEAFSTCRNREGRLCLIWEARPFPPAGIRRYWEGRPFTACRKRQGRAALFGRGGLFPPASVDREGCALSMLYLGGEAFFSPASVDQRSR